VCIPGKLEILRPCPGEKVQAFKGKTTSTCSVFVAGRAQRARVAADFAAFLVSNDSPPKVYQGKFVKKGLSANMGLHWIITFSTLPSPSAQGDDYYLVVAENGSGIKGKMAVARTLTILPPVSYLAAQPSRRRGRAGLPLGPYVSIASPDSHSSVCPIFVASGSASNPAWVSGFMDNGPNRPVAGAVVTDPDAPDLWMLPFSTVPEGHDYILTVNLTDPATGTVVANATKIDITVTASACPPPTPDPPPGGN
jgi:hypothetical protein